MCCEHSQPFPVAGRAQPLLAPLQICERQIHRHHTRCTTYVTKLRAAETKRGRGGVTLVSLVTQGGVRLRLSEDQQRANRILRLASLGRSSAGLLVQIAAAVLACAGCAEVRPPSDRTARYVPRVDQNRGPHTAALSYSIRYTIPVSSQQSVSQV